MFVGPISLSSMRIWSVDAKFATRHSLQTCPSLWQHWQDFETNLFFFFLRSSFFPQHFFFFKEKFHCFATFFFRLQS